MKIPVIDFGECANCEACLELCPSVFRRNDMGYIEVVDMSEYPEEEIDEIIKNCPGQCITWKED
jgi:ferredoxin